MTESFLTHSFFITYTCFYQLYIGLCQATYVQSHQRRPRSTVTICTCEVQVSAADSQAIQTVTTGVTKPLCCRLILTYTLTSGNLLLFILLHYFSWSLYNYAAYVADILTPTTVVQGVDNRSQGLYCRRCYCICVCWGRSSRIFHFSCWFGQLITVPAKDESPSLLQFPFCYDVTLGPVTCTKESIRCNMLLKSWHAPINLHVCHHHDCWWPGTRPSATTLLTWLWLCYDVTQMYYATCIT